MTNNRLTHFLPAQQPISLDEPNVIEKEATTSLVVFIDDHDEPDSEDLVIKRQEVLERLNYLITEFVREIARKTGNDANGLENVQGLLVPYGSYRLGVVSSGSDIDCICVCPFFVTRTHFFTIFFDMIKDHSLIKDLIKIENAYSPIMSFKFEGIEIDLSFASLALPTIPHDIDFLNDHILDNIDEESVRSLNGRRTNDMLLELVPNKENFRFLLRFTRIWAKKRGLYGNVFGYFGGINLAILSAFICQRYPKKSPAFLIYRFFADLGSWEWPSPILLNHPIKSGTKENWDPTMKSEGKKDYMPIITPSYPTINSLRSATKSTRDYLTHEFKYAEKLALEILEKSKSWQILIQTPVFFNHWKYYVHILLKTDNENLLKDWTGFVQSKIKSLIINLENIRFIEHAYPFPKFFDSSNQHDYPYTTSAFVALKYHIPKTENSSRAISITGPVNDWIKEMKFFRGSKFNINEVDIICNPLKRSELPSYVLN